ncbi:Cytochrome b-c1 complex subunit Rieske [Penicillium taxi]|uniref:Cytochrome b-c1 complex subunit Rieske n=1 Tax=Penicillium taxi TaxID=168475 RepID=UPI0025450339|nr:Cytochrome b-c1 complex subunit Rieske [Penicillium taxi]KAJ5894212.1 Cytochrome b-c1 complex subunit Rieske [Penicillium taxi]
MTVLVIPIASESSGFQLQPSRLHPLDHHLLSHSPLFQPTQLRSTPSRVVNCITMSLSSASSTLLRTCARQQLPTTRAAVTSCQQRRGVADAKASFESPFVNAGERGSTVKIPNFGKYQSKSSPRSNHVFSYFMAGTMGLASAVGAKATVQDFLVNMSASADVLAQAKVEIALGAIPEGKNVIIKWRGKPVFIRHRTQSEIDEARQTKWETFRDPQSDEDRVQRPEWLVMLGVCTHLGCVPIGEAGDYGGWFCPCHGSHYDISGRIRRGPAPLNLEIPAYQFPEDETLVIG